MAKAKIKNSESEQRLPVKERFVTGLFDLVDFQSELIFKPFTEQLETLENLPASAFKKQSKTNNEPSDKRRRNDSTPAMDDSQKNSTRANNSN